MLVALSFCVLTAANPDAACAAMRAAVDALAGRLGPSAAITVESLNAATWPDAALGCGVPGGNTPPAPASGYRVLLRSSGAVHAVHVAAERVVVCPQSFTAGPPLAETDRQPGKPKMTGPVPPAVTAAMTDLAARLRVRREDIEVVKAEEVTWRDGSLGCPQPGLEYTQALVNGMLIVLRVKGQEYEYHSGAGGAPQLCEGRAQKPFPPLQ